MDDPYAGYGTYTERRAVIVRSLPTEMYEALSRPAPHELLQPSKKPRRTEARPAVAVKAKPQYRPLEQMLMPNLAPGRRVTCGELPQTYPLPELPLPDPQLPPPHSAQRFTITAQQAAELCALPGATLSQRLANLALEAWVAQLSPAERHARAAAQVSSGNPAWNRFDQCYARHDAYCTFISEFSQQCR